MIKVGIDVGGTNTDAVIMKDRAILHSCKNATTKDVMSGVLNALREVCVGANVPFHAIDAVMIGTTHFTNALIERRDLSPVASIRLGAPATTGLPPLTAWPEDFIAAANIRSYMTKGGYEFDGRDLADLDVPELKRIAELIARAGIRDVAISSVFSFLNSDQEERAAEIIRKTVPNVRLTLSSHLGRIGLLERENATILNACLGDLANSVVSAFEAALQESGILAPFYLTQNDGTLLNAQQARHFPILTVASGPTNSMRGAAVLSGLRNAIVVDIGGTTSDVGVLIDGFPRQSGVAVEVGGVRTNFRMPDVYSIGLGGGSIVNASFTDIGPQSVGYRIRSEALIYGGSTVTATDIAVAAGVARLGDARRVSDLQRAQVADCYEHIKTKLFNAIERMRTSSEPLPIIIVGGGSILVGNSLQGIPVIVPPAFGVANAVGAAMAQVSGEVSRVVVLDGVARHEAIAIAREDATALAVAAGANPDTISVLDVEETPLAYLPGNATRIHLRVVGDLL